jgi:hypothetical protein
MAIIGTLDYKRYYLTIIITDFLLKLSFSNVSSLILFILIKLPVDDCDRNLLLMREFASCHEL